MTTKDAITTFSQSDKIRSGLSWAGRMLRQLDRFSGSELRGAIRIVEIVLLMIREEVQLVRRLTSGDAWLDVETQLDLALAMVGADAPNEAEAQVVKVFFQVTQIGRQQIALLKAKGVF